MTVRPLPLLIACLLGVLAALATSCGGDRSRLIAQTDAQSIVRQLEAVQGAVEQGTASCGAADAAANRARSAISNLPDGVDARLRSRLSTGAARLKDRAATECTRQTGKTIQTVQTTTTQLPETQSTATQAPTTKTAPPTTSTTTEIPPPQDTSTTTAPATTDSTGGISPGTDTSGGDSSGGTGGTGGTGGAGG